MVQATLSTVLVPPNSDKLPVSHDATSPCVCVPQCDNVHQMYLRFIICEYIFKHVATLVDDVVLAVFAGQVVLAEKV